MNNLNSLKENTNHGNFILPFSTYHCTFNPTFNVVPIHWHEEMEISFVHEGEGIHMIDLDSYKIEQGDIIIVKPSSLHSINQYNANTMHWSTMVFNLNMINTALTDGCLLKYFAPMFNNKTEPCIIIKQKNTGYEEIVSTIKNIFSCYKDKNSAFELELKSYIYYLFFLIYKNNLVKNNNFNILTEDTIKKIKTIINYIQENYAHDISIKDLAFHCNFSEYHFMRFFKKYIGMTCIEYINNYRLELASKKLIESNETILNISFDVGYNNVSYFNKLFKRKYNITPKKFRIRKRKI